MTEKKKVYGKPKTTRDIYRLRTPAVLYLSVSLIIWAATLLSRGKRGAKLLPDFTWAFCSAIFFYLDPNKPPSPEGRDRKIGPLILSVDPGAQMIPPCFMTMTWKLYPASLVLQKIRQYEITTRYCLYDSVIKKKKKDTLDFSFFLELSKIEKTLKYEKP